MSNCILLSLPDKLSDRVLSWAKEHISSSDIYGKDGKGYEHAPHITAAYGIDDDNVEGAVKRALDGVGPFTVKLGAVDFFMDPTKEYHVIKISVLPGPAEEFHERVVSNVGMYDPTYEYHPHITLAYVKPGRCQDLMGDQSFAGEDVEISSGMLMTDDNNPKRIRFGGMHGVDS